MCVVGRAHEQTHPTHPPLIGICRINMNDISIIFDKKNNNFPFLQKRNLKSTYDFDYLEIEYKKYFSSKIIKNQIGFPNFGAVMKHKCYNLIIIDDLYILGRCGVAPHKFFILVRSKLNIII